MKSNNNMSMFQALFLSMSIAFALMQFRVFPARKNSARSSSDHNKLTLRPGDLPGYTGWARPSQTLVGWFELDRAPPVATTGHYWTVQVTCHHSKCSRGGSLLDVRAYGTSVLSGKVYDYGNGTYDIAVYFVDPGVYHVEVVLAFSQVASLDHFPLKQEPLYEGHLLPDFPLQVKVGSKAAVSHRLCQSLDLVESSTTSAIESGRWVVVDKTTRRRANDPDSDKVSLQGYQSGMNSLGIQTEYRPSNCFLSDPKQAKKLLELSTKERQKHVIFIGDSNMQRQHQLFRKQYVNRDIRSTYVSTKKGLALRLPKIRQALEELRARQSPEEDFYVLFNSGLHDIAQLCSQRWTKERHTYIHESFSCTERYRQDLTELVRILQAFPTRLLVFQTTVAGWPKWGNFGFAWPPGEGQHFPLATQACEYFNTIAWDIMKAGKIPVMDAFWLTLARPDHREVTPGNEIGSHLVHAGPEIYSVLVRKWIMLVANKDHAFRLP